MRTFALAALLAALPAAGCSGGDVSATVPIPEHLRRVTRLVPPVSDRHPYGDVAKVKVGQWARYREGERVFTIAAVGKAGEETWVEVIEEGETREASARLVAPGGAVKRAFFREITKDGPTEVVPQALEQAARAAAAPEHGLREGGREKVTIGGRDLEAAVVRVRTEDDEGRIAEEVLLWHPDVPPVHSGCELGGLVRRKTARTLLELVAFGTDAKPAVDLPR